MPQRLLILSSSDAFRESTLSLLHQTGYPATAIDSLTRPSSLSQAHALCLIDLDLRHDKGGEEWARWLRDCLQTETACLAFNSRTTPDPADIGSLTPLCDTLSDPQDKEQLLGKIRSLLTIRKLNRQLEAARQQMYDYQTSLQDALESAAHIQRRLIPKSRPNYHNLRFDWRYMPCKQVGGDLFNIAQLDEDTVMVYLFDVSGHGISSAMVAVSVHQSLSIHTGQLVKHLTEYPPFYAITSPQKVLQQLEEEYPFERFDEFFTISYLLINAKTGDVRYCNAGHPPPVLLRHNGDIERLDAGGTIIGVGQPVEFEEGHTKMHNGDRLYMYTDGITEHIAGEGEPYGERRFLDSLKKKNGTSLVDATRYAMIAMREYGGSSLPVDDVTLIGAEFK